MSSLLRPPDSGRLRAQAEAAAQAGDWPRALDLWRQLNATSGATSATLLGESRACLARGLAGQAERALRRAVAADPADTEAWLLLLKILRVEDRLLDAFRLGWTAIEQVAPDARAELLRELTLAALTDLPDDLARTTLKRWIDADPADIDARVAYLRRIGAEPRSADPDREARLAELSELLASHPDHVGVREALVTALADAGEPDRGRTILESWPIADRDGRYWRLRGRWDLEHDHLPEQAVTALRAATRGFPPGLAHPLPPGTSPQDHGSSPKKRAERRRPSAGSESCSTRSSSSRKLDASFAHLDQPAALQALAELCSRAGLIRLADAWRAIEPTSDQDPGPGSDDQAVMFTSAVETAARPTPW